MRLMVLSILFTAALAAADVTGTWRGTITTEMDGGRMPAYMTLTQSDRAVTGSAGGSEKMLFKIREGRIDGDRLTVEVSPREGAVLRFTLTVKGEVLEGPVQENGQPVGTARLVRER